MLTSVREGHTHAREDRGASKRRRAVKWRSLCGALSLLRLAARLAFRLLGGGGGRAWCGRVCEWASPFLAGALLLLALASAQKGTGGGTGAPGTECAVILVSPAFARW